MWLGGCPGGLTLTRFRRGGSLMCGLGRWRCFKRSAHTTPCQSQSGKEQSRRNVDRLEHQASEKTKVSHIFDGQNTPKAPLTVPIRQRHPSCLTGLALFFQPLRPGSSHFQHVLWRSSPIALPAFDRIVHAEHRKHSFRDARLHVLHHL